MDQIEAALADLRLQDQPNISATAKCYNVNRSTLSKRFNGVQQSKEEGYELQRLLSNAQSNALIKYINTLTERGLPPTNAMVRNFAADIAGRQPGPHWMSRWLKAHSKELKSGYLTPIDSSRKRSKSAYYYALYFELLARKIAQYEVEPEDTYNMDEKGFLLGQLLKVRRIFSRAAFESGRIKHVIQDGNREWITLIAIICADGTYLSPGLIY